MLTREQAEQILALHAEGYSIYEIARRCHHSPQTVRGYIHGRRTPGIKTPIRDRFADFAGYAQRRLHDDPHIGAALLFEEVTTLGYPGSRPTFYRALHRHALLHIIGDHPKPKTPSPRAIPTRPIGALPRLLSPLSGEILISYLGRLAAANHVTTDDLLTVLPPWFRTKLCNHDDRSCHHLLAPATTDALHHLALLSGRSPQALQRALPAFSGQHLPDPVRVTTACRRCAARDGIHHPVPVLVPAHQQICIRHGIWLSPPDHPQLDLTTCPEIIIAQHHNRRLLRRHSAHHVLFAHTQAAALLAENPDSSQEHAQRLEQLLAANQHIPAPPDPEDLEQAVSYPQITNHAKAFLATN